MLRPEEAAGANLLQNTLTKLMVESTWKPGGDPPDIVFDVKDQGRWAVEVTTLYQYFDKAVVPESRASATAPLIKMSERLDAQIRDLINSDYLVTGFGPVRKPSLREIERRAAAYIRSGKSDEEPLDDENRIRIGRRTRPVRVGWMVGLHHATAGAGGTSLSVDIRANVTFALDRIMEAKLPILAELTGYDRKMLLILRNYMFAEPEMVKEILDARSLERSQVDTILLATEEEVHWVADPGRVFV